MALHVLGVARAGRSSVPELSWTNQLFPGLWRGLWGIWKHQLPASSAQGLTFLHCSWKGPRCSCVTREGVAWDAVIMGLATLELDAATIKQQGPWGLEPQLLIFVLHRETSDHPLAPSSLTHETGT